MYGCVDNKLDMMRWIHNRKNYSQLIYKKAFIMACFYGYLYIAQWLYAQNNGINIHDCNDYALRCSHKNGHKNITQWLCSIYDYRYISISRYIFIM